MARWTAERRERIRLVGVPILKYWETRRPVYNGVLLLLTLRDFADDGALGMLTEPRVLFALAGLALLANLAYCAAHVVDFALQWLGFRERWLRARPLLLLAGCLLAAAIVHQETGLITGLVRMV